MDPRPASAGAAIPRGDDFPFRVETSFAPLIESWEEAAADDSSVCAELARTILRALEHVPLLRQPIADPAGLAPHRSLLDALMSGVFPQVYLEQDFGAALVPFHLRSVYATPAFERLLMDEYGALRGTVSTDERRLRLLHAYAHVLRQFYAIEIAPDLPLALTITDPANGLERHFKMLFDGTFLTLEAPAGPPPLTPEGRQRILADPSDPQVMLDLLPPDRFLFRGITVFKAIEVTDQEVLSSIKRDLIDRESIVSTAAFRRLQVKLQALFRRPDLGFALAAIDGEQVLLLNTSTRIEHGCIFADSVHYARAEFAGSIYEKALLANAPLVIGDLTRYRERGRVEEQVLAKGLRSLVLAALRYQDATIGLLELHSPHPGDFGPGLDMKLQEVLPLFSMAVKRSLDELNTRIQTVIKEQCTAIHPSVEWRFRRAVMNAINAHPTGAPVDLGPIVFENVYPLYALTDIRGSSTQRNLAIQADLTVHLQMALDLVRAAHLEQGLPILDALAYRIGREIDGLERGIKSGDELAMVSFVRHYVEPVLAHVERVVPRLRGRVAEYRAAVEPRLGTVFRRRKAFEESVTLINEAVAAHLDAEEHRAQAMFPHYFERQKTDGVEWTMYVGDSLVEHGGFEPLHLRNLRLWQLQVLCGLARRIDALRSRLPVPLETTHLVLAQHAPLAIRFRFDEKRFDVDGTYNIRYEVIKKRIDKAVLLGTKERLTQPGRIAIVYSQPHEADEYREYLEYLQARDELRPGVEDLQLDALQGMEGLRALRVAVNLEPRATRPVDTDGRRLAATPR